MYSFIFRKIHFSYDFTRAKLHFSYEISKLKLHFSNDSYIKISQTSLIDLFGIWILYVVMGYGFWVMGYGLWVMGFWLWVWYLKIRTFGIVARKITVEASF